MLLFLFLFGLALGAVTPSDDLGLALGAVTSFDDYELTLQQGNCAAMWYNFNGRFYKYVGIHLTWADAELHCVSKGANLVSIHSLEEQKFVKSLIKNSDPAEGKTWIGLSDIHKEGTWMSSDGSAANFFYWTSRQPDNANGVEHCVQTNYPGELKWNDDPCSRTFPFVCASRK
ncbi:lactose-binding lectin l-2-like [Cebidichthys violaceus]|uniref:lactose-binding lectin l-2-like n=1 Tax=Cebidichthys violaceus TaxID=271503 RepID=UPI0035C98ADB